jgi:hypothetical protein
MQEVLGSILYSIVNKKKVLVRPYHEFTTISNMILMLYIIYLFMHLITKKQTMNYGVIVKYEMSMLPHFLFFGTRLYDIFIFW